MTLVEFLLARIDDDEAAGREFGDDGTVGTWSHWVLAECDAKRRIVERIKHYQKFHISDDFSGEDLCDDVLSLLASVYASHPDYREEWAGSLADTPGTVGPIGPP